MKIGFEKMAVNTIKVKENDFQAIASCISVLDIGIPIVFPTETVYDLACSAKKLEYYEKIYALKGRDINKPLALMVADKSELAKFDLHFSHQIKNIMDAYGHLFVTSANLSSEKDAINFNQVLQYFDGKINLAVDGGDCQITKPSMVILASTPIKILSEGAIGSKELET